MSKISLGRLSELAPNDDDKKVVFEIIPRRKFEWLTNGVWSAKLFARRLLKPVFLFKPPLKSPLASRKIRVNIEFSAVDLFMGVAIDPTCYIIGRLERTEPNRIHFKWGSRVNRHSVYLRQVTIVTCLRKLVFESPYLYYMEISVRLAGAEFFFCFWLEETFVASSVELHGVRRADSHRINLVYTLKAISK